MKGSRWPHTVVVQVVGRQTVRLACTGKRCSWQSPPMTEPTISSLTLAAQDHRQAMRASA